MADVTDPDDVSNEADDSGSGSDDPAAAVMALLAPGAPFEMADEDVLANPCRSSSSGPGRSAIS